MQIQLPWGESTLDLQLPDTWDIIFPKASDTAGIQSHDELAIVRQALDQPAGSPPLRDLDLAGKDILIISDDNTRPTPVARFFHEILETLRQAGADFERILLMPALGIHTAMTGEEMAEKVGAENLGRIRWRNHDAFDAGAMAEFGVTSRGTPVILNEAIAEADFVITLGVVEPHIWAGFGGGMKNILPGIASAECIGYHHAIIAEPPYLFNRVGMEPERNSFRLDLEEVQGMIDAPIFCLNVSLDQQGRIVGAFAGDPIAAHRQGVAFNKRVSGRYLDHQVDGIIVNSRPMDINLKQGMKGVGNSLPALKPGGVVMGFLRAERGIDDLVLPEKSRPLWLTKRILRLAGPSRTMAVLERTAGALNVEEKFLRYYSMQLIRGYELYIYVPTISEANVRQLGAFDYIDEPQTVMARARKKLGARATVAVFPEAGATFPIVGGLESHQ